MLEDAQATHDLQGTPGLTPLPAVPTAARTNGHPRGDRRRDLGLPPDSASTVLSSELESSSFIDSDEDDNTSRCVCGCEQVGVWVCASGHVGVGVWMSWVRMCESMCMYTGWGKCAYVHRCVVVYAQVCACAGVTGVCARGRACTGVRACCVVCTGACVPVRVHAVHTSVCQCSWPCCLPCVCVRVCLRVVTHLPTPVGVGFAACHVCGVVCVYNQEQNLVLSKLPRPPRLPHSTSGTRPTAPSVLIL